MENISTYYPVLKQWFFKDVLANEKFLSAIGNFYPGVLTGDSIGFMPVAGYEDGAIAGCNPEYSVGEITSNKKWEIADIGIYKKWCAENIEAELKRGKALYDLSADELMVKVFSTDLGTSMANNSLALAFFGDKTSANVKLKIVDGIIKQVQTIVSGNEFRRTKLAENSKAAFGEPGVATDMMLKLVEDADPVLRAASDAQIIMTQATYDALQRDLNANKGIYVDAQLETLYAGMKKGTWAGYDVIVIPALDKIISGVSGVPLTNPIFALFTTKSNLMFGSSNDSDAGTGEVKIWEDEKEDMTYGKVKYSLGVQVAVEELVQALY